MERRQVERYAMPLKADVRVAGAVKAAADGHMALVRDISARGVSFFSDRQWQDGDALLLEIWFGSEVVRPYSYRLKVGGTVVRTGLDAPSGRGYCAVAFAGSKAIHDWREMPTGGGR